MRNSSILFLSVMVPSAWASPAATSQPTVTPIPPTATASPTGTPTATPEPLVIVKPVEGKQKEALNKYFWEETFFTLNKGSKYFQEFGYEDYLAYRWFREQLGNRNYEAPQVFQMAQ